MQSIVNRHILLLSCLLIAHAISGLSQSLIKGEVRDGETQSPLPGVNIYLPETQYGTSTDSLGQFQIASPTGKDFTLQATCVGYASFQINIPPNKTTNTPLSILLTPISLQVDGIEIQATRNLQLLRDKPLRLEIITPEEIRAQSGQTADQLLESLSGITVNRDFGIFSDKSVVSLRGIGGNNQSRTLIAIDGIPQNKSDGGSVNWNQITPEQLARIEVIKGPGTARYGNNAMGGVINFVTREPQKKLAGHLSTEFGTYNTWGTELGLSGKHKKFWYAIFGKTRHSDGYINQPEEEILACDSVVVPAYLRELNISAKAGLLLAPNHRLKLQISRYDDKRGRGIEIYEQDGSWSSHANWKSQLSYSGLYHGLQIKANLYSSRENYYKVNEYFASGEYMLYDVDAIRQDAGAQIHLQYLPTAHLAWRWGGEYTQGSVDGSDIYYTSTDRVSNQGKCGLYGLYFENEWAPLNEKIKLLAGCRLDGATFSDGLFTIENPSYSLAYLAHFRDTLVNTTHWLAISPKLSFQYKMVPSTKLFISLAKGFRAPILDDLCRTGKRRSGFQKANPALEPEKIYTTEGGINFEPSPLFQLESSIYYSAGIDFMYGVSTGDSVDMGYQILPVYQTGNIGRVDISGWETDLKIEFSRFIVRGSYTLNHSEIIEYKIPGTGADFDLTGKQLTDLPKHKATASIQWNNPWLPLQIQWNYIGKGWINERNTTDYRYLYRQQFPDYFTVNLKIRRSINAHFEASLTADNLFNRVYRTSKGYRSPGRFVMGKLSYRL